MGRVPQFSYGPPAWIDWNGQRWYRMSGTRHQKRGHYRNPGGDLLHRAVWEYTNGPIPDGGVIHHRNHDKADNLPGNLVLKGSLSEHIREEHPLSSEEAARRGRKSHGGRALWDNRLPQRHTCRQCGGEFWSTGMRAMFCNGTCRARFRRARLRAAALAGSPHLRPGS
jgi:hypothetical protein